MAAEKQTAYVLEQVKPGNRKGDVKLIVSVVDFKVGKSIPSQKSFEEQVGPGFRLVRRATKEIVRVS